jgi:outer membrane protein assembly factor BamE
MYKKLIFIICLAFSLSLSLTACEPHRIDIQQGNKIKPETLEKLKIGMTRKQVVFLLGTPLLKDPFHHDRWDYVFYLKPGNQAVKQSRVTLHFKQGRLITINDAAYAPEMHNSSSDSNFDDADTENLAPAAPAHQH